MNVFRKTLIITLVIITVSLLFYYIYPVQKIPANITIDKIAILKSKHELHAFSKGNLIVTYKIGIGKNATGAKEIEGDMKTPEGVYQISDKNFNSDFHKNLGVSYPNQQDILHAKLLGKAPGADIKIHGLKNGQGYFGKFHRFRDWTNGCIALTNDEMDQLYDHTPVGTSVEIRK